MKCLIYRVYKINNTWLGFHKDVQEVYQILRRNCYPQHILEKITNNYLNKKLCQAEIAKTQDQKNKSYFKLPYIGDYSKKCKLKIEKICQTFCNNTDIRIVFQSQKIGSMFSVKDKQKLNSRVVYRYHCSECNSEYIGFTTRHYQTRVNEHLFSDTASHIFKHINNNAKCKAVANESSFRVIDCANTEYELRINEAMYIQWTAPSINKQKISLKLTLIV